MKSLWFVIDANCRKHPYDAVDEADALRQHYAYCSNGNAHAIDVWYACKATSVHWADMCIDMQRLKSEKDALGSRLSDIAEEG